MPPSPREDTHVGSLNTLRAILVGATAVTALIALGFGQWLVAAVLGGAVVVHGYLWLYLYRAGAFDKDRLPTPVPPPRS